MVKPTAADLRADTRIDWATTFRLPVADPDPLVLEIAIAWAYVEEVTGRDLDTLDDDNLEILAIEAVKLRVIQQAAFKTGQYTILTNQQSGIISFSVPGYSETRAAPGTTTTQMTGAATINPWSELDDLLWLLATEEKRDEYLYLATGKHRPSLGFTHTAQNLPLYGIERSGQSYP